MENLKHRKGKLPEMEEYIPDEPFLKTKKKKKGGRIGPCLCMSIVFIFAAGLIFGRRMFSYARSQLAKDHVPDWLTDERVLAQSSELLSDPALAKGSCQLPLYPDRQARPTQDDFIRRFWENSRTAVVINEVGTAFWGHRELVNSKSSLQQAVMNSGSWVLHYHHSNKTVMETHIHLSRVFNPVDVFEAPWAEFTVPATHGDIPGHFLPVDPDSQWKAAIIPALSGRSPTITESTLYITVLSGSLRVIVYRPSHAFHASDSHVYEWNDNSFDRVRSSGNHGKMCVVKTDQSLLIPSRYGYSFMAVANTVILEVIAKDA
eukprot:TRINITY_DN12008_c1_g1_i1.p1 TRINITY_DN12008_c1_g1~~TRINITY_DN12008_c1_g1_i1.p1  ORF type:complete len:318 (+),score=43.29 TRINITY_DN12008_c1_g1_i1:91-1044(+)